jgi:hypothetical protein
MKELYEKVRKVLRHNQFVALAAVLCVVLAVWIFGCESTVQSPLNPERKVTRAQLTLEKDKYLAEIQLAYENLNQQDLFKQKLTEIGVIVAQGGTVNPVGAGVGLLALLGVGAVADNRKKDSIIKTQKNNSNGGTVA